MADPPSSPDISSVSSSDLDTQSTGSFFHDTSITLGTLMGVNLQPRTSFAGEPVPIAAAADGRRDGGRKLRRRKWWRRLCGEESDSKRASLREYLEVERRFGNVSAAAELEEGLVGEVAKNGRALFADGRVLPPAKAEGVGGGGGGFEERCCCSCCDFIYLHSTPLDFFV
ncbi:hypothetical protein M569_16534 [Genlisea aurea]|uniref:Uncharacterized protein n=1 Tax=Genlisea aurea TaxID=192259 RepID=S8C1F6_9LAMI|nr:hypothetical protein M569_16534 [Genlisea aurea]